MTDKKRLSRTSGTSYKTVWGGRSIHGNRSTRLHAYDETDVNRDVDIIILLGKANFGCSDSEWMFYSVLAGRPSYTTAIPTVDCYKGQRNLQQNSLDTWKWNANIYCITSDWSWCSLPRFKRSTLGVRAFPVAGAHCLERYSGARHIVTIIMATFKIKLEAELFNDHTKNEFEPDV